MEEKKYHDKRIINWVVAILPVVAYSSNKNNQSVVSDTTSNSTNLNTEQDSRNTAKFLSNKCTGKA